LKATVEEFSRAYAEASPTGKRLCGSGCVAICDSDNCQDDAK
jgi:hypothetical protein